LVVRILGVVGTVALFSACNGRDSTTVGRAGAGGDGAGGSVANGGSGNGGSAGSTGGDSAAGSAGVGGDGGSAGDPDAGDASVIDASAPDATTGDAGDAGPTADAGDAGPSTAELCAAMCSLQGTFHSATPCDDFDEVDCAVQCGIPPNFLPATCADEYDAFISCLTVADSWECDGNPSQPQATPGTCAAEEGAAFSGC
jgi:hypothetical protein